MVVTTEFWIAYAVSYVIAARYFTAFWHKEMNAHRDNVDFSDVMLGWYTAFFWPPCVAGYLIYKGSKALYARCPNVKYVFVARPPKRKRLEDKRTKLLARTAELERELDLR